MLSSGLGVMRWRLLITTNTEPLHPTSGRSAYHKAECFDDSPQCHALSFSATCLLVLLFISWCVQTGAQLDKLFWSPGLAKPGSAWCMVAECPDGADELHGGVTRGSLPGSQTCVLHPPWGTRPPGLVSMCESLTRHLLGTWQFFTKDFLRCSCLVCALLRLSALRPLALGCVPFDLRSAVSELCSRRLLLTDHLQARDQPDQDGSRFTDFELDLLTSRLTPPATPHLTISALPTTWTRQLTPWSPLPAGGSTSSVFGLSCLCSSWFLPTLHHVEPCLTWPGLH